MDYTIRIRKLREDHDETQTEIAALLETTQTLNSRYELGKTELPIRHLIKLAKHYGVTTDYILGLSEK